jgi:hypothetical protein
MDVSIRSPSFELPVTTAEVARFTAGKIAVASMHAHITQAMVMIAVVIAASDI